MSVKVPIIFIFFNRPDTTMQALESIRAARPEKLYLVSDGARPTTLGEKERVAQLREEVERNIDWQCNVHRIYADKNMGCHRRMVSGITAVFEQEEKAIIIEDDIVPIQSFYQYCEELLERYKDEEKIYFISGNNMMQEPEMDESYIFSKYPSIWGWATWKRAWSQFDDTMEKWNAIKKSGCMNQYYGRDSIVRFYASQFESAFTGKCDTWDYQWEANRMWNGGIGIIPKYNLICNIGFNREDATHTKGDSQYDFSTKVMNFPLKHPAAITVNEKYDKLYKEKIIDSDYFKSTIMGKILKKLKIKK